MLEEQLGNRKRKKRKFRLKSKISKRSERKYRNRLMLVIADLDREIKEQVLPLLKRRNDSIVDDVYAALDRLRGLSAYSNINVQSFANMIQRDKINELEKTIGVDLFSRLATFDFSDIMGAWVAENTSLISAMSTQYIARVSSEISEGLKLGLRYEEIAEKLTKASGISINKAKLIARNEISNLNGQITVKRNQDLGIKEYKWRTSRDERVRGNPSGLYPKAVPSHFDREGKTYSFKDGAAGLDKHPGYGIQCRCTAESIIIFED